METIPLAEGDLHWVFPELADPDGVLDLVHRAAAEIRLLADHLGVRPSWTGSGVEFHRMDLGQTYLFGCVEAGDVSFVAELWVPRLCAWDTKAGPPWQVDAEITVRCDGRSDCVSHYIEEIAPRDFDSPLLAARALVEAATWLRERGIAEPLTSWRPRDERSGHD